MSLSQGDSIFCAVIGLLLFVSVFGNVVTVVMIVKDRKLHTVTNVLICNLAISDTLLAAVGLPQQLHDMALEEDYYNCK